MRAMLRVAAVCALLGMILPRAIAQQVYNAGTMTFQRNGHNQWGAPGEFGELLWEKVSDPVTISIPFGPLVNLDPTGTVDLETGGGLVFDITGKAGIGVRVYGKNGVLNATYPMGVTLTYPDPRTLKPGDPFSIGSSFTRQSGGSLSSTAPDFGFRLSAILIADVAVRAVLKILGVGADITILDPDPLDLSTSIFDTDFPFFKEAVNLSDGKFSLFGGVVEGTYGFPHVTTSGGDGPGNTLIASGSDDFIKINFSITDAILVLLGLPALNGGDCIFDNQVCYEFHILDLFIDNTFTLLQNFTLTPKPKITLQFSNGLPAVQFDAGTSVNLTMPTVSAGATSNDLTITPTFTMNADVRNESTLKIGAGLFFNPLYGHLEVHITTDLGDVNFDEDIGFSDIELISGDVDVNLIDKTFEMKGFNAITKSPFTVEGFRYPTPTISEVSPALRALNSGAFTLTVTGAGYVDSYTNTGGTIPGSKVRWDGSERATTFVNGTTLSASIPASDTAVEGIHMVTVFNPPPGGGSSNAVPVIVDGSPPVITGTANPALLDKTGNPNVLVSVIISGKITDALSGVDPTTATYSVDDEYNLVEPSGSITLNPDGTYSFVVRLSPLRDPKDADGRLYQITIQAKDKLGFTGSQVVTVVVPKG